MSRPAYTRTGEPCHPDEDAPVLDSSCSDCPNEADLIYEGVPLCLPCAGQRAADRRVDARLEREDR